MRLAIVWISDDCICALLCLRMVALRPNAASYDVRIVVVRAMTKTSSDIRRCRASHNLRARCDRVVAKRGPLVADGPRLPEEDKRQFYVECEDKVGNEARTEKSNNAHSAQTTKGAPDMQNAAH